MISLEKFAQKLGAIWEIIIVTTGFEKLPKV